jgi:hypothetical protein
MKNTAAYTQETSNGVTVEGMLAFCLTATIYCLYLWPKYITLGSAGTRISPYNIFVLCSIFLCIFLLVVGKSTRFRRDSIVIISLFVLYFLFRFLSSVFGPAPSTSIYITVREFTWVGLPFFIGIAAATSWRLQASLIDIICASLVGILVLVIIEVLAQRTIGAILLSVLPVDIDAGLERTLIFDKTRDGATRAQSVFIHPIVMGIVAASGFPLALWQAQSGDNKRLGIAALVACVACVFLSGSRSAQITLIVAAFAYGLFYIIAQHGRRAIPLVLALGPLLLAVSFYGYGVAMDIAVGQTSAEIESTLVRDMQWIRGGDAISGSWLFGYGDGMDLVYGAIFSARNQIWTIDDYYLSLLLTTGVVGLTLIILVALAAAWRAASMVRRSEPKAPAMKAAALAAAAAAILVGQKATSISEAMAFFNLYCGMIAGMSLSPRPVASTLAGQKLGG